MLVKRPACIPKSVYHRGDICFHIGTDVRSVLVLLAEFLHSDLRLVTIGSVSATRFNLLYLYLLFIHHAGSTDKSLCYDSPATRSESLVYHLTCPSLSPLPVPCPLFAKPRERHRHNKYLEFPAVARDTFLWRDISIKHLETKFHLFQSASVRAYVHSTRGWRFMLLRRTWKQSRFTSRGRRLDAIKRFKAFPREIAEYVSNV